MLPHRRPPYLAPRRMTATTLIIVAAAVAVIALAVIGSW